MWIIYKYPLEATDYQRITMPIGAKVLTVQMQRGVPCLWAEIEGPINTDLETEEREFVVIGTGHAFHPKGTYIGTFQTLGGDFVGHVYEIGK